MHHQQINKSLPAITVSGAPKVNNCTGIIDTSGTEKGFSGMQW